MAKLNIETFYMWLGSVWVKSFIALPQARAI